MREFSSLLKASVTGVGLREDTLSKRRALIRASIPKKADETIEEDEEKKAGTIEKEEEEEEEKGEEKGEEKEEKEGEWEGGEEEKKEVLASKVNNLYINSIMKKFIYINFTFY